MFNTRHLFLGVLLASIVSGLVVAAVILYVNPLEKPASQSFDQKQSLRFSSLEKADVIVPEGLNFIYAAELVTPAVVHIKTTYSASASGNNRQQDLFREFFGEGQGGFHNFPMPGPSASSGSGVILSADGYIVTNNHVVNNASKIEVVLEDKRTFQATVVGTDPTTDLALVKIDADNLPFVKFGDSDRLRVGEWVLAVGNPFDLTSTVTAGIVSAKGRNIDILRSENNQLAIESFIQTDAAVNPGNSGGALVDLKGQLVGINTAIATRNGGYQGYSFAVPISLAKKVVDDLLKYGEVQRALLGIQIQDVDGAFASSKGLTVTKGVYVARVNEKGAAEAAGIKEGDVIVKLNDKSISSTSELQELVARNRPGDKITVSVIREGKEKTLSATLRNVNGDVKPMKREPATLNKALGLELGEASKDELEALKIDAGVKIKRILAGKIKEETNIREGFIITAIDKRKISKPSDVEMVINQKSGGFLIEGIYPNGEKAYYAIGW
jgi:Do/DeqQ family serine protease